MTGRLVDHLKSLIRSGVANISEDTDAKVTRNEKTLVVVRHQLGKLIVDRRALARALAEPPPAAQLLSQKAEMAVCKGREDLARAAMSEASRLTSGRQSIVDDIAAMDADIALLEAAIAHLTGQKPQTETNPAEQASLRALLAELDDLEGKPEAMRRRSQDT